MSKIGKISAAVVIAVFALWLLLTVVYVVSGPVVPAVQPPPTPARLMGSAYSGPSLSSTDGGTFFRNSAGTTVRLRTYGDPITETGEYVVNADRTCATDATAATQATIVAACASGALGTEVVFQPGCYKLSNALVIPCDLALICSSPGTTLRFTTAADGVRWEIPPPGFRATMRGCLIEQTADATGRMLADAGASDGYAAIRVDNVVGLGVGTRTQILSLRDVIVRGGGGMWGYGLWGADLENATIDNFKEFSSALVGVHCETSCNATTISNSEIVGEGGAPPHVLRIGVEVSGNSQDFSLYNTTVQGYFVEAGLLFSGSSPTMFGGHIEVTNPSPSRGSHVVLDGSLAAQFYGVHGGSWLIGANGSFASSVIVDGLFTDFGITLGAGTTSCEIRNSRLGSTPVNQGSFNETANNTVGGSPIPDTYRRDWTTIINPVQTQIDGGVQEVFTIPFQAQTQAFIEPSHPGGVVLNVLPSVPSFGTRSLRLIVYWDPGATITTWPTSWVWSGTPPTNGPQNTATIIDLTLFNGKCFARASEPG
jgi:hypothetical protein